MPEDEKKLLTEGVRLAIAMLPQTTMYARCSALSISPTTLSRWLAGVAEPSPARLARLSRKSGVSEEIIRNGGRKVEVEA